MAFKWHFKSASQDVWMAHTPTEMQKPTCAACVRNERVMGIKTESKGRAVYRNGVGYNRGQNIEPIGRRGPAGERWDTCIQTEQGFLGAPLHMRSIWLLALNAEQLSWKWILSSEWTWSKHTNTWHRSVFLLKQTTHVGEGAEKMLLINGAGRLISLAQYSASGWYTAAR